MRYEIAALRIRGREGTKHFWGTAVLWSPLSFSPDIVNATDDADNAAAGAATVSRLRSYAFLS